jgi:hypothetical protein
MVRWSCRLPLLYLVILNFPTSLANLTTNPALAVFLGRRCGSHRIPGARLDELHALGTAVPHLRPMHPVDHESLLSQSMT